MINSPLRINKEPTSGTKKRKILHHRRTSMNDEIDIVNEQPVGSSPHTFSRLNTNLRRIESNNEEWSMSESQNKETTAKKLKKSVTIKDHKKSPRKML
jgi:hypothetical protein